MKEGTYRSVGGGDGSVEMDSIPATATQGRRWPGVVFSLFVPGMGLLRAGRIRRGVVWYVALLLGPIFASVLASLEWLPIQMGLVLFTSFIPLQIWMLVDSFRPGKMTANLWGWFVGVFVGFMFLPLIDLLPVRMFRVPTGSMAPTLTGATEKHSGEFVLVSRLSYMWSGPERGDILCFGTSGIQGASMYRPPTDGEVYYVHRVVGLPGERIKIEGGQIYADGKLLGKEDGVLPLPYQLPDRKLIRRIKYPLSADGEAQLGAGEYFVLGDNTGNSFDSRYWGMVPEDAVYGKLTKIVYPFTRMGAAKHPEE